MQKFYKEMDLNKFMKEKQTKKSDAHQKIQEEVEKMKDGEWIFEMLGWRSKNKDGKND